MKGVLSWPKAVYKRVSVWNSGGGGGVPVQSFVENLLPGIIVD